MKYSVYSIESRNFAVSSIVKGPVSLCSKSSIDLLIAPTDVIGLKFNQYLLKNDL